MSDDPQPNRLWLTCNTFDADHQADAMAESLVSSAAQARGVSVDTAADDAGRSTAVTASPITSRIADPDTPYSICQLCAFGEMAGDIESSESFDGRSRSWRTRERNG